MKAKYELVYKTNVTPFFPMCLMARSYCSDDYTDVFGLKIGTIKPLLGILNKGYVKLVFGTMN